MIQTESTQDNAALVLDACCGSRMMWFDKTDHRAIFCDIRQSSHQLCDGRELHINPDKVMDFCNIEFSDNTFDLVVFDPPHLIQAGENSWLGLKYGILDDDWKNKISIGFSECFRVLRPKGALIFKWSEVQIKTSEILKLTPYKPLFGHQSGKRSGTHWICFLKIDDL